MRLFPLAFAAVGIASLASRSLAGDSAPPTLTTLYRFNAQNGGGFTPYSGVVIGPDGTLFGTTIQGGIASAACTTSCGTVFQVVPPLQPGGAWVESVIYRFQGGSDGYSPTGTLVIGTDGTLYGTTQGGGMNGTGTCAMYGCGTVFSLTPPAAGGAWTETVLHRFTGFDGSEPAAGLVIGKGGILYGTTMYAGASSQCLYGCGTVFALAPPASAGGAWTSQVIFRFTGADGANPRAALTMGANGTLYGTTTTGGSVGVGTVFALLPPGGVGAAWTETVLHSFSRSGNDGWEPVAPLILGNDGALYGTTLKGGNFTLGAGTVFALTPGGSGGGWNETVLHAFVSGTPGGGFPAGGLTMGPAGVLYGTVTQDGANPGAVFALTPPASQGGAWTESILHAFTSTDGNDPLAGVTMGVNGVLYGTTSGGPLTQAGTVFALTP